MFLMTLFDLIMVLISALLNRRRKQHFKSATTGVATKTMRNELNRLVNTVADPATRKVRVDSLSSQMKRCEWMWVGL